MTEVKVELKMIIVIPIRVVYSTEESIAIIMPLLFRQWTMFSGICCVTHKVYAVLIGVLWLGVLLNFTCLQYKCLN